jgi:hypothetical protein
MSQSTISTQAEPSRSSISPLSPKYQNSTQLETRVERIATPRLPKKIHPVENTITPSQSLEPMQLKHEIKVYQSATMYNQTESEDNVCNRSVIRTCY